MSNSMSASQDKGEAWAYLESKESAARTYARRFQQSFSHARGVWITDNNGRRYIDCLSNAGTLALGHNHPEVKAATLSFLNEDRLQQALDLSTPAKAAFAREIFALAPSPLRERGRIQFCSPSGSDAVEAALKLARLHTGRRGIWAFGGAYHGMTAGALAAMGNLSAKAGASASDVNFMPFPYRYRCPFGTSGDQTDLLSLRYIETCLQDPEGGLERPAAIIVELIQGEGGCIPASDAWVRGLRDITRRAGVLLIVDEVQTGLGRTGRTLACDHTGVSPDILVLSKAIGGGYPMAVIVYDEALDTWHPGAHAGTFRGNQIAMVAGAATIGIVARDGLAAHAETLGLYFMARLRDILADRPIVSDVRGRGLMIGVELASRDEGGRQVRSDGFLAAQMRTACFAEGIIVETGGRNGSVLRFLPPLIITRDEIDQVLEGFTRALDQAIRTDQARS